MESNTAIVLIGMMGAGKTTLGRSLAKRLARVFYDSDEEISREQGVEIAEIFKNRGEAYFRDLERRKIAELLKLKNIVLSVGGGAVTIPETSEIIFKHFVLWVDASLEVLTERVGAGEDRPLLKGMDIKPALAQKLLERQKIYARADLRIINDGPLDDVLENCVRQIEFSLLKI